MLDVDAYDHAQEVFGPSAGVWRAAPKRCLVGRWKSLGELAVPTVGARPNAGPSSRSPNADGMYSVGDTPVVIFKTKRQGFEVLGEGETWALAFAAAEAHRIKYMAPSPHSAAGKALARASKTSNGTTHGDELGPVLDEVTQ